MLREGESADDRDQEGGGGLGKHVRDSSGTSFNEREHARRLHTKAKA